MSYPVPRGQKSYKHFNQDMLDKNNTSIFHKSSCSHKSKLLVAKEEQIHKMN